MVHPAAGHWTGTLVHALLDKVDDLEGIGGELRPGIVHRLDKDTTGLLVVAKSERAMASLQEQIREHLVQRVDWALVHGNSMPDTGRIEAPIGRHPRRPQAHGGQPQDRARRRHLLPVLERYRGYALLECRLETGGPTRSGCTCPSSATRWSAIPCTAPASRTWGCRRRPCTPGRLSFRHPATGEWMEFRVDPPEDMMAVIRRLREEA